VVVGVVAALLVFVAVASTVGYLLAYWNFRLTRHSGGTFHVSRGLLTTRATSIDVSRLRGVGISESILMRLVGGARTTAVATGLDVRRNSPGNRGGTVLLPDAPVDEARRVAGEVLRQPDLVAADLLDHGPTARRRRYARALGGASLLAGVFALVWSGLSLPGLGSLLGLVFLPIGAAVATDRARNLGHLVRNGFLVSQSGTLIRRRVILEADAIIGWNIRRSYFQRRAGVATLVATTAAGRQSYQLLDLSLPEVRRVGDSAVPGLLDEFSAS
jgi:putative membrane protein